GTLAVFEARHEEITPQLELGPIACDIRGDGETKLVLTGLNRRADLVDKMLAFDKAVRIRNREPQQHGVSPYGLIRRRPNRGRRRRYDGQLDGQARNEAVGFALIIER